MVQASKIKTFICLIECTIFTNLGQARFKPGSTFKAYEKPSNKWADISDYEEGMTYRQILEAILADDFGIRNGEHYNDATRDSWLQHKYLEETRNKLETDKKENLLAYAKTIKAIVHPGWQSWQMADAIKKREAEIYSETGELPEELKPKKEKK